MLFRSLGPRTAVASRARLGSWMFAPARRMTETRAATRNRRTRGPFNGTVPLRSLSLRVFLEKRHAMRFEPPRCRVDVSMLSDRVVPSPLSCPPNWASWFPFAAHNLLHRFNITQSCENARVRDRGSVAIGIRGDEALMHHALLRGSSPLPTSGDAKRL